MVVCWPRNFTTKINEALDLSGSCCQLAVGWGRTVSPSESLHRLAFPECLLSTMECGKNRGRYLGNVLKVYLQTDSSGRRSYS